jgi:succinyl-CoA synthetase beta subunit
MELDESALFRHPDLLELREDDLNDLDDLDTRRAGLSFVRLEGNIGCVVNGAGLAMATMDAIKRFGGMPANFLDIGGAGGKKVPAAFEAILRDTRVRVVLVNVFGGITRCDEVARGVLDALDQFDVAVPVVVRLTGTNEAEGRALLHAAEVTFAETLEQAAERAVEIGGGA